MGSKRLEANENLRLLSQHMHINAFHEVWLGSNTNGFLESLPHDMMHAFLHGVMMYVIEVIMSPRIQVRNMNWISWLIRLWFQ